MILIKSIFSGGRVFAANPLPWNIPRCATQVTINGATEEIATIQGFECLVSNILRVVISLIGVVFAVMIVVGGFKFIFSGGDKGEVQKASKTLTSAFMGLAAVILIWLGMLFLQEFTGAQNLLDFVIPGP